MRRACDSHHTKIDKGRDKSKNGNNRNTSSTGTCTLSPDSTYNLGVMSQR